MAQVSNLAKGVQNPHLRPNLPKISNPKSLCSVSFGSSKLRDFSSLNHKSLAFINRSVKVPLRVSASTATADKPSTVPEITLQPIKDISGTVKLPGSKSLSNRILLLAALSEVIMLVYQIIVQIKVVASASMRRAF